MSRRANWCIVAVAITCLSAGAILSRQVEPGVRVKAITLAGDTPALQFIPADPGLHPVALLAHGVTASKETLFCLGEALAAAGFMCFAMDLPGHGASTQLFSHDECVRTLETVAQTLEPLDVFVGHSMGAYLGAGAAYDGGLSPRLFIAVGALPILGEHGPPLLLLAGEFEEAIPPALLKTRTNLVLFPWCDHALEPFDPHLVNTAVEAACATVGRTPPPAPTCWLWRLAGMVLGLLGAFGLAFGLPGFPPRWALLRGPLVAVIVIVAVALTTSTWFSAAPHLRHAPQQIVLIALAWLVVAGAGRLRIPRWTFPVLAAAVVISCVLTGSFFLALLVSLTTLILFAGTVLGWIATRRGFRRDGDLAMAIFVGYAIGQLIPTLF